MAELVSIKRNVDVSPGQAAPAVFHCSQGDVGSKIILGLLNNGTTYAIPSGVTVTIEGSESNGSIFTPISATASGSDITFYLTGEMTAVAGPAICQAVLKSGSNILGTANFTLEVESSPMGADAPPVFTDAGWTWMLNKLNTEFVPALGDNIIDAIESKADQSDLTALSNTVAGHTGSITVLNNTVNTLNGGVTENRQNIATKLDKNQGTANAGKYLKVGANGDVETADLDVTTDKTLSIADKAADAKAVGDELDDLKSALPNTYVALAGENQVTPQNIAGMQFTKTKGTVDGENIFSSDMLFRDGQYVVSSEGTVSIGSNADFKSYCVPVEQNSTYVFPECRFVVLATGNTVNSPAVGNTITNVSQVETSNATYLFLSYSDKPVGEITVKKRETAIVYSDFILPDWLNQKPVEKPKFKSASGSLSDGSALIVQGCRNNTRKGERVVFYGNITSFNSIDFGISISEASIASGTRNTFTIDGTNITYTESPYSTPVVVQHGLTIADNIQIIGEEGVDATYTLTVVSDGYLFAHEFNNYSQKVIGAPYVSSTGSVIADAKLTWTCTDLDKQIWMFGDSYFAYSPDRWTYYLHEYGYDQNCLLDGWSGMGSINARVSFNNLLIYGTPRFAIWCMGMNDGGDSGSTPSTDWSTQRDIFLQYCNENEVTPVFATIPTVPSINNEAKNAWVRSSGYRYIDFALAVGASSSGAWYSGMLSSDNVHPTEKGARALFVRFLVDFPEIMIEQ